MARNSTKARRLCFEAHKVVYASGKVRLECHICKVYMDPVRDKWEADHIRRYAEGGEDHPANLWPVCVHCHKRKSAKDTSDIAKGKRVRDKHFGIKQRGWHRPDGVKFDWKQGRYRKDEH